MSYGNSVSTDPQIIAFNTYFGISDNSPNPQDRAFTAGIKESVLTFYNVLGVSFTPPAYDGGQQAPLPTATPFSSQYDAHSSVPYSHSYEQIHIHHHHHNTDSALNNPFFWLWLGNRQPTYRTYQHRSMRSDVTMRANRMMQVAGSGHQNTEKNEEKAKKKIFLMGMCVALADIVAAVTAIYVTVVALKQASDAKNQKQKFAQIESSLRPTLPYTGDPQNDPTTHLKEIGSNLKAIGDREARCSKYRAISIATLATAGVGAVHVISSAIACGIITGSASLSVSSAGAAALAFFSASCAPPVLIAVATIAAVGTVIYLALQIYNKKAKDTHNAREGLAHLNALTQLAVNQAPPAYNYVAPSAPLMPGTFPQPSAPPAPPEYTSH